MSDDMQMLRDLGEVKAELSAVKAELAGLRERIDDVVISNLRDHGKRMSMLETRVAALEAAENRRAGGMAALVAVAAAAGAARERPFALDRWISGSHISAEAISNFGKRCHGKEQYHAQDEPQFHGIPDQQPYRCWPPHCPGTGTTPSAIRPAPCVPPPSSRRRCRPRGSSAPPDRRPLMPTRPLFRTVETAAAITDSVLVSFSGGKDSVATLDLCVKHFRHVEGFFMYYVKGLSFQEQICRYYEDRYGLPIHRVPHFELSQFLRYGLYRPTDFSVPVVSVKDVYNYLRPNTDIWWIAAGERIADSVWRLGHHQSSSGTIDEKRGRIYPVAEWRKEDVVAYIRQNKLKVGVESRKLGFSFGSLQAREVIPVKRHFPADFARIRAWFPFVEAGIIHHQIKEERRGRETQQVPEV